jgi:hypothetical protein
LDLHRNIRGERESTVRIPRLSQLLLIYNFPQVENLFAKESRLLGKEKEKIIDLQPLYLSTTMNSRMGRMQVKPHVTLTCALRGPK